MTEARAEIRRRAKAAAIVAFAAELDALTERATRLAGLDPETSARAGAIHVVISREIQALQKELPDAGE